MIIGIVLVAISLIVVVLTVALHNQQNELNYLSRKIKGLEDFLGLEKYDDYKILDLGRYWVHQNPKTTSKEDIKKTVKMTKMMLDYFNLEYVKEKEKLQKTKKQYEIHTKKRGSAGN